MGDLAERASELRALLLLGRLADLAEPERAQRSAVAEALPDLAPYLGDPHLRHRPGPPPLPEQPRRRPARRQAPRPSASSMGGPRRSRARAPSRRPPDGAAA